MKNKNKTLFYIVGGAVVIGLLGGVTAFKQGGLFQGDLSTQHFAAPEQNTAKVSILVPTNQIRMGEMPFLKFNVSGTSAMTIEKLKINVHAYDMTISNLRIMRNGHDITSLLTPESQSILKEGLEGKGQSVVKVLSLEFASPLHFEQAQDIYELRDNTDFISKVSTLRSSLIDIVVKGQNGESVIEGPQEITNLEVTYLPTEK